MSEACMRIPTEPFQRLFGEDLSEKGGISDPLSREFPTFNPFSTRAVDPGAIPFHFDPPFLEKCRERYPIEAQRYLVESFVRSTIASTWIGACFLTDFFKRMNGRAQIVGPHGSGKSTLLCSLRESFKVSGYSVFSWTLHDQQRTLSQEFWSQLKTLQKEKQPVLFLDGFEQLSILQRWKLRHHCHLHGIGYLLTTHTPVFFLPVLYRTTTSWELVRDLVDYLLDDETFPLADDEIKKLFTRHRGNCRSILFDLYDRFEESLWS